MPKKAERWNDPEAHVALRQLYERHVAVTGISQADFGSKYGIGTQGMVWQYLSGHKPLSLEAAVRFAKALNCTIRDISPPLADALESEVLPVLGLKSFRRAAMLAGLAVLASASLTQSDQAQAKSGPHNAFSVYYVKSHLCKHLASAYLFILLFSQWFRQVGVV